ncbi:hypothetical protein LPH44_09260 [Xylella taiwanensis]|nr:hypothetical protein [Xylella taiwanensis]MCD8459623.1 hypothetical protein [Xylella taiwanensis]MCD8461510.1 hypothetical protein [Xylella taiwanensis]MCD8466247.1 hypothetical protein [Xylella taiwanensis]MCD8468431.1 hypothetical protein [Xylella taiwanensis]UFN09614.1 hypothetical protein LPH45_02915 [Xylella taiwanensis]
MHHAQNRLLNKTELQACNAPLDGPHPRYALRPTPYALRPACSALLQQLD